MSEIVEQLRDAARFLDELEDFPELQIRAAAEITRLREENSRLIRENKVAFEAVGGVVKANDKLKEENARLREALKPFAEMQLWTDAYPDGPLSATSKERFVDPLWIVAAREAIREGRESD